MDALLQRGSAKTPLTLSIGKNISVGVKALRSAYGSPSSLESDLLHVAAVVYAADLASKRNPREDFVRTIELEVPVVNLASFKSVQSQLERTLRVLSCDNWTLRFVAAAGTPEPNRTWPEAVGTTLLFSGGLDSFAGACDLLQREQKVFLVSHVTHNRPVASSQTALVDEVTRHYGTTVSHLPVLVFCRQFKDLSFPQDTEREETQRTRSFLFTVLAAVAARMNGSRRVLVMAENGQFAIHLPLTAARVGPFSTHTAHPEFLSNMQGLLRDLLLCPDLTLTNPFELKTKAEVVELIPAELRPSIEKSISCWMTSRLTDKTHCGECVPCISRRLALEANGISFDEYKRDLFTEDVGNLPPDDNGKRNLSELLEFIARFYGPHAITDDQDLSIEIPELINPFVNQRETIRMYRRFAESATRTLKSYRRVSKLLK